MQYEEKSKDPSYSGYLLGKLQCIMLLVCHLYDYGYHSYEAESNVKRQMQWPWHSDCFNDNTTCLIQLQDAKYFCLQTHY